MSSPIPPRGSSARAFVPSEPMPRVLLVDDEPESLYLFARMLVNAGIRNQIDVADGGEEAIDYLQRCFSGEYPWPAAVFLDINMPMVDGFEVLEWAKARGVLEKTVVVMLTSSDEPEDVARAFALGAHFYIPKDARRGALTELLQNAMRITPGGSAAEQATG